MRYAVGATITTEVTMGKMKELLDQRLDENKYELLKILRKLADEWAVRADIDVLTDYFGQARVLIDRIEKL